MALLNPAYRKPFTIAIVLHILLIAVLIVELPKGAGMAAPAVAVNKKPTPIVQATAVNQTQVEQRIQQLKAQQAAKKAAQQRYLDNLKAKADAAKRQRQQELKRVAALITQQKKLKAQQIAHQKALAKLKQQQKVAAQKARAQKIAALKAQQQALQAKQAKLQQQMLQQQMQAEQQQLTHAKAVADQGLINKYSAAIKGAIRQHWVLLPSFKKNLSCEYLINIGPGGAVLSVKLLRSSGDSVLDRSARTAIYKAAPLPVPKDPALFDKFRQIHITMSPKQILQ